MTKKMTPAEFVKYAAENHIKFSLPEDNRKFPCQQCQDEQLTYSFRKLHLDIVNMVIKWCKDNNVEIDEFHLSADGLKESIPTGEWQACTDSGFTLKSVANEEHNNEPYLFSM